MSRKNRLGEHSNKGVEAERSKNRQRGGSQTSHKVSHIGHGRRQFQERGVIFDSKISELRE